jgi:Tfp pilus assembly protein FimT
VELIVVIVVLGLCAAVVAPKVPALLLREPEPWQSARKFLRRAQYARELAIATESTLVLRIEAETGDYQVQSKEGSGELDAAMSADLRGRLSQDVTITRIDSAGRDPVEGAWSIEFSPEGWCEPALMAISASDGRTVTVAISEWAGETRLLEEGSAR